jgi:hypothetical protein
MQSAGSVYGPVAGYCEHGNEPSVSIRDEEFFDQLSDYQLLKNYSAPWNNLICVLSLSERPSFALIQNND